MCCLNTNINKVGWDYSSHSYQCQQQQHNQGFIPAKFLSSVDGLRERKDKKRVNWTKDI